MLRSSSYLVATALGLVILVGAASGCGNSSEKSFRAHGVSFQYPKNWESATFTGNSAQNARGLWTEAFKPRSSSSKADVIFVSEYQTPVAITKRNRAIYSDEVASSVSEVAKQAGGSLLAGPNEVTIGGLPGYAFRISATTRDNLSSASRILLVWSGKREYYLNCQHDTSGGYAAEVERGCKKIVGSFKLSR
jgi:hypothetical protein